MLPKGCTDSNLRNSRSLCAEIAKCALVALSVSKYMSKGVGLGVQAVDIDIVSLIAIISVAVGFAGQAGLLWMTLHGLAPSAHIFSVTNGAT